MCLKSSYTKCIGGNSLILSQVQLDLKKNRNLFVWLYATRHLNITKQVLKWNVLFVHVWRPKYFNTIHRCEIVLNETSVFFCVWTVRFVDMLFKLLTSKTLIYLSVTNVSIRKDICVDIDKSFWVRTESSLVYRLFSSNYTQVASKRLVIILAKNQKLFRIQNLDLFRRINL